jgi:GTPase SAR1 family protein
MYSRSASAAVLVVDVSAMTSYESVDTWYAMLKQQCPETARIYVVANKIDLPVKIPMAELEEWAVSRRCGFFKSCATKYQTVEPIFARIAEDATGEAGMVGAAMQPLEKGEEARCC